MSVELVVRPEEYQDQEGLSKIKAILDEADFENPGNATLAKLESVFQHHPEVWRLTGDLARLAVNTVINKSIKSELVNHSVRHGVRAIRRDLGYDHSPMLERVLIEQVAACSVGM